MQEVLPGVFHWSATHPRIGFEVSSYWLEDAGVLLDPLIPPDAGLEWFSRRAVPPVAIVLSNRHHYRQSDDFVERFGVGVRCARAGLHEFTDGEPVTGFEPGDTLPGPIVVHEVGGICPDDMALYIPTQRAIAFADGVVRGGMHGQSGPFGFVPDSLMDDPPQTKRALLDAFAELLAQLDFDHVLLPHGGPVIGDGRAQLQDLVDCGGRTAFEL
jgi:glyoxylase-like metal-dependent hydrolase (beta-lactamase superfamily II)